MNLNRSREGWWASGRNLYENLIERLRMQVLLSKIGHWGRRAPA